MNWKNTHEKALGIGNDFKRSESELIGVLQKVEQDKVFTFLGFTSLFRYCVEFLKLTEEQSFTYIQIARASVEVPAIKEAIEKKKLSISNAKKICSVITPETQSEWLEKGQNLSCRNLEKEIVKAHPEKALDIVAKTMGQTLEQVLKEFVEKHDPVKKAERSLARKKQLVTRPPYRNGKRTPIPLSLKHQAMKEANGACSVKGCANRRYRQVHHCQPVSLGGKHELSNLRVLCSAHHRMEHECTSTPQSGRRRSSKPEHFSTQNPSRDVRVSS